MNRCNADKKNKICRINCYINFTITAPGVGGGGGGDILLNPKFIFFCLKLHAKFRSPSTTPSGRKVCGTEKRKRNNNKYSGHFLPQQRPRAAHALHFDQKSSILNEAITYQNVHFAYD
jgi:hypothetical protein